MNERWIVKEGKTWVDEGIITEEQYNKIVAKYPADTKRGIGLIPIFASILIGLGILSFIASNWDGISPAFRLILLLVIMFAFYTTGHSQLSKGNNNLGKAFIALGITSFGASLILLGQTFHFVSYDARTFAIWSLPAIVYLLTLRGRLFFFLSFAILTGGQLYAISEFSSFSYLILVLFGAALGWYAYKEKDRKIPWFYAAGLTLHLFLFSTQLEENWLWFLILVLSLYAAADVAKDKFAAPLRFFASGSAFFVSLFLYFLLTNEASERHYPEPLWYAIAFVFFMGISLYLKKQKGTLQAGYKNWLLFVPWFYLSYAVGEFTAGIIYLIAAFLFSGIVLSEGYQKEKRPQINLGIALFLLVTFIAYINLAWSFMPKSLFFLIGGVLLFALYFFLQKKKKDVLEEGGASNEKK